MTKASKLDIFAMKMNFFSIFKMLSLLATWTWLNGIWKQVSRWHFCYSSCRSFDDSQIERLTNPDEAERATILAIATLWNGKIK